MRSVLFLIVLTVASVVARSTATAADATDNMKVHRDIAYAEPKGSDKALTSLDVYSPVTGKDHPIMVWIHGGGWTKGDKAQVALKPNAFVERGFVLVSLNYRLAPAVNYSGQAADIAQAIRWVHDHAKDYGGSPNRIFVMGHSAGAHLAALVATDDRYLKSQELPLTTIKGVVLLDGAGYDFARRIEGAGPEAKKSFEAVFGTEKNAVQDASPVNFITKGKGIPPFLIIHVADRAESKAQSAILADALRKAGAVAEVVPAPGKTHGTLNQELGKPGDQPTKATFDFLDKGEAAATADTKPAAGTTEQTLKHGGLDRAYRIHVPPSYDGKKPVPLVFTFHGGEGSSLIAEKGLGFNPLSDKHGFIVVYPEGVEHHWNDGRVSPRFPNATKIDDVGFIRALIDHLEKTYAIDPMRIYSTGNSNGGFISQRLGWELSDKLAAIAPSAGTLGENVVKQFAPKYAIHVLEIHGTADPAVPYKGGSVIGQGGMVISVPEMIRLAALDANLAVFPKETAQVLEYWLDVSRFSRWKRPAVKLPWKTDVFLADVETYRKRGIRHITTFAAWVDANYKSRFGNLDFIAEYGEGLAGG